MKLKEIRLEKIKIFKDDNQLYEGPIENAPDELLNTDVVSLEFKESILIAKI